jgi:leader peptidase (prepilin peptidase)/N-methyltransferase
VTPHLVAALVAGLLGAAATPFLVAAVERLLRSGARVVPMAGVAIGAAAACLPALLVLRFGSDALLPGLLVFAVSGVVLSAVDVLELRLPNVLVLPSAVVVIALLTAGEAVEDRPTMVVTAAAGAVGLSGVYLLLAVVARGRFGMGDVKFGLVAGAAIGVLGVHGWVLGLVAGVVINGLVALSALVTRRMPLLGSIPFGPSIFAGAMVALLLA